MLALVNSYNIKFCVLHRILRRVSTNCQRVRPSEDRRPGEVADYRAARRFLGRLNLRSASNLSVM